MDLKRKVRYRKLGIVCFLGFVLFSAFGLYELQMYDNSVLELYAEHQDAYVQLVLDQINLLDERSNNEIVDEILSSLDASEKRYWTFSEEQSLIFLKNVMETNRYKGFTTSTFYDTESAEEFLKSLQMNRVTHEKIHVEDSTYVASGVLYEYNGAEYRLCLLTDKSVILDSNDYLFTKISNAIFNLVLIVLIVFSVLIFTYFLRNSQEKKEELEKKLEDRNRQIEHLKNSIKAHESYYSRWSMFNADLLGIFIKKLKDRGVAHVTLIELSFFDKESKKVFLEKAQVMLDEKILRFFYEEHIILLYINYSMKEAEKTLRFADENLVTIEKKCEMRKLDTMWQEYCKFMNIDGKGTKEA